MTKLQCKLVSRKSAMANRNAKPVAMLTNQNDSLSINAAAAVHNSNFPVSSASHFYNQSDVTSSTNQKQVAMLGFETQQNVTSMMPYLSVPIRGDSSMIYPTLVGPCFTIGLNIE